VFAFEYDVHARSFPASLNGEIGVEVADWLCRSVLALELFLTTYLKSGECSLVLLIITYWPVACQNRTFASELATWLEGDPSYLAAGCHKQVRSGV
jgi:hypothetical protein